MASENFINECEKSANSNRLGTIVVDGIETPITESNNLKKFSIDSSCYVDGSIIGSVYITKLTGEFISVPDDVELIEKTIQAQIGVKFDDDTSEYIEMGKYTIERPNDLKTANKCQITAYNDLINKVNSKYVNSIDYSNKNITVKELYVDVCEQLGLTPKTTEFINDDIPINNNPFTNNETNRTVLQSIAKVACSYITIDYDTNEIDLSWVSDNDEPDYIFTKDDYSILEGGTIQYGPINSVTIKNSQIDDENVSKLNQENIELYGEHSIAISEDYILYDAELRLQAIEKIFERLNGFKYVDSKIVCYCGKPFLKIGDKIRIYTTDTEYIDTYVLKHIFTYDGTFESTIESPSLTEQEIKTKQDISLGQALKNTQIEVNKQNGKIIALSSRVTTEVNTLNNKINGVSANFEDFKDNEYINSIANLQDQIDGAIQFWNGSEIPTIDNYPANEWITEADKNNHRADIYTVIQDIDGEMKQGKSYRFDKVGNVWQWIELTDNELSAVQAIAQESLNKVNNILNTRQSVSGNGHLYLENALEHDAIEYGIDGKSEQETTPSPDYPSEIESVSGKNLFDVNQELQTYTVGGNTRRGFELPNGLSNVVLSVQPKENYEFIEAGFQIRLLNDDGTNDLVDRIVTTTNGLVKYFTLDPTKKYIFVCVSTSDLTKTKQYLDSFDWQLEKGSVATDYIPYKHIGIKITGKNLFDGEFESGIISGSTGSNSSNDSYIRNKNYIPVEPNTNYKFSTDSTLFSRVFVYEYKKDGTYNLTSNKNIDLNEYLTTNEDTYFIRFRPAVAFTDTNIKVQLEKGTVASEYEEYKENITTIQLDEPLRSLPNGVKDKLYVQNNKLYVERYVGSVVLDGSENWVMGQFSTTGNYYYKVGAIDLGQNTSSSNVLSTHFIQKSNWSEQIVGIWLDTNLIITTQGSLDNTDTLEDFKTWLSTHNTQVDYALATPITEELGDISIPLFEGINNVSLIANMDTNTNVTYLLKTLLSGEYFTKLETQAYVQITEDKIVSEVGTKINGVSTTSGNQYQELLKKFDGYTPQSDFVSLEKNVQQIQTDTYTKTEINTKLTDGSVTKVLTTSGTFDENGMHYEKTGAKTSSTINEKGVEVDSTTTGEELLFAGYDEEINQTIVRTENLTVRKYLVIGENSRIEDYGNGGGVFIL